MRKIQLLIIFFQLTQFGNAQQFSRFDFFIGYGFYEGFSMGSEYFIKSKKHSISASIGYDKFINKNQENISFSLSYNFAIFRIHKTDSSKYKWHINNKVVLWQLVDEYYIWRVVSIIPSINKTFKIYKKIKISFDAGPAFNIVLYNKRKTYKEIGWPYHVMPDFRILFIF